LKKLEIIIIIATSLLLDISVKFKGEIFIFNLILVGVVEN